MEILLENNPKKSRSVITQQIIAFILSFLFLFLICEGFVRQAVDLSHAPQSAYVLTDAKFHLAKRSYKKEESTILLLGDSLMNMGIYSELLELRLEEAGYKAQVRNLGNPGSNIRMSLFLLKQAIQAGAQPRFVVFNLNPSLFNGKNSWESETALRSSYIGQCYYNPPTTFFKKLDCNLQKSFFLFRYRGFLKERALKSFTIMTKVDKNLRKNLWGDKPHVYHDISPQGWAPGYRIYFRPSVQTVKTPISMQNTPAKLDDWDETAYRELKSYCNKQHIPLLLVWFPYHSDEASKAAQWEKSLQQQFQALADNQGVWFMNMHGNRLKDAGYYDNDHVNVLGSIELTEQLAHTLLSTPAFKPIVTSLQPSKTKKTL